MLKKLTKWKSSESHNGDFVACFCLGCLDDTGDVEDDEDDDDEISFSFSSWLRYSSMDNECIINIEENV